MKRLTILFLFVLYLLSATEAKQFLKVSTLFEHYAEHKNNNNAITFLNFIYMHYIGSDFDDSDQSRDMQLPFKSSSSIIPDISNYTSTSSPVAIRPVVSIQNQLVYSLDVDFHSMYLSSIWQPPKLV